MCQTYNTIGSLTTLKNHLESNHIHDFKSLKEVMDFRNNYPVLRQKIIKEYEYLIEQEKNTLQYDLEHLDKGIEDHKKRTKFQLEADIEMQKLLLQSLAIAQPASFFKKLINFIFQWYYKLKVYHQERNLNSKIQKSVTELERIRQQKNNRYHFISSQFEEAVKLSSKYPLGELERKKEVIEEISSFIPGALGEHKVVKTLENLSDEYFLINDFSISFSKTIYIKSENEYIKSIQADHILVAPSGIFLIETKNWNDNSLENTNLRSPVRQIRRTSFALFKLLNTEDANDYLIMGHHHWGKLKIPMKSLIVLTNSKPNEEFQFVKIISINQLLNYIRYFKPIFSYDETQNITDYLLQINEQKLIRLD